VKDLKVLLRSHLGVEYESIIPRIIDSTSESSKCLLGMIYTAGFPSVIY